MKQFFAALIFAVILIVAFSGVLPNNGGPPPLEWVAQQIADGIHLR